MEWLTLFLQTIDTSWRDRRALVLENLVLRQQLVILTRPTRKRPRLRRRDRLFWLLVRHLWGDWRQHLLVVRVELRDETEVSRRGGLRFDVFASCHELGPS